MTEQEQMLEHLTRVVGLSAEDAERRMRDRDLWGFLHPEMRDGLPDTEETVEEWRRAVVGLEDMQAWAEWIGSAAQTVIWDAMNRAEEAHRRARARAKEAAGEKELSK